MSDITRVVPYGEEHTEIVSPFGPPPTPDQVLERFEDLHRGKTRAQLDARREACIARAAQLGDYEHPSQAQREEFDQLTAETIVIDGLIKADDVKIRRAKIEAIARTAQDPANLERPVGVPPLVKGLGGPAGDGGRGAAAGGQPVA